jgi:glycosyltransferase involved in cell wall biosynthesis
MRTKVSAVIITHNEAINLKYTLRQLHWCDEIIIVDSYSTDDTIAICKAHGCKIFYRMFNGYGEQKHFAIEQASNDWVLCIDADEYLTQALVDELREELNDTGDNQGYMVPMNLVFLGREFKYGKESHRYFLRLFNKKRCHQGMEKVHENFKVLGPVKKVRNLIRHYSYRGVDQYLIKLERYSTLGAETNIESGKKRPQALVYISIPYYFIRYYLMDGNILNGKEGFYWSMLSSFYHFIKYLKMQDIMQGRYVPENNTKVSLTVADTSETSVHIRLAKHGS